MKHFLGGGTVLECSDLFGLFKAFRICLNLLWLNTWYLGLFSPLGASRHLWAHLDSSCTSQNFFSVSTPIIIIPGDEKECLSNCVDQLMTVTLSQATYPNNHAFDKTKEFCYVLKKLIRSCNGDRRESLIDEYPGICDNVLAVENSVTSRRQTTILCMVPFNVKISNPDPSKYFWAA